MKFFNLCRSSSPKYQLLKQQNPMEMDLQFHDEQKVENANEAKFIEMFLKNKYEGVKKHLSENPHWVHLTFKKNEMETYDLLCYAISEKFNDIVRLLLDYEANVNTILIQKTKNSILTPLSIAVNVENEEIVPLLLSKGADVNFLVNNQYPIVLLAFKKNNENIFKMILAHPPFDVNVKDEHGHTILEHTVALNNEIFTKLLIDRGANVNVLYKEEMLQCPLLSYLIMSKTIISKGGDIWDHPKMKIFCMLATHPDIDLEAKTTFLTNHVNMEDIVTHDSDIHITEEMLLKKQNKTPLELALAKNKKRYVKILIENGASVEPIAQYKDTDPYTLMLFTRLLSFAISNEKHDLIQILQSSKEKID